MTDTQIVRLVFSMACLIVIFIVIYGSWLRDKKKYVVQQSGNAVIQLPKGIAGMMISLTKHDGHIIPLYVYSFPGDQFYGFQNGDALIMNIANAACTLEFIEKDISGVWKIETSATGIGKI